MRLLRIMWKDILWLNSRRPAVKLAGLIIVIFLIWGAWYLGTDFWNMKTAFRRGGGYAPRWERTLVLLGVGLVCYIISLFHRLPKKR